MAIYVGYVGAKSCTDGPTDGARALMSWFLAAYDGKGARNSGIYNCRDVRGGSTTSLHGEGRAADLGIDEPRKRWRTLADRLRENSKELGIQCVIYNRRIWSGAHPYEGWRTYTGSNPHRDHLHVELSWPAARNLTTQRIRNVLGGDMPTAKEVAEAVWRHEIPHTSPKNADNPGWYAQNFLRHMETSQDEVVSLLRQVAQQVGAPVDIDEAALAREILAGLAEMPDQVAGLVVDSVGPEVAARVVDELGRRINQQEG